MKRFIVLAAMLLLHMGISSRGQAPAEPPQAEVQLLSDSELDVLLGPIALYPDPLLAVLLPAATQPHEIVVAVRYLNGGGDMDRVEAQPWSDSVKALIYYPDVIRWLDENLEWTAQVGRAFLNQPEAVMDTIQRLRALAQSLGNLQTDAQQIVEVNDGEIDILPTDPDAVYVPVYDPYVVFTRPPIFGAGPHVSFGRRWPTGGWLKYDWDWRNRRVVIWSKEHSRPRTWWSQSRADRFRTSAHFQEWCPRPRRGQVQCKWWATRRQQIENGATAGKATPSQTPKNAFRGGTNGRGQNQRGSSTTSPKSP